MGNLSANFKQTLISIEGFVLFIRDDVFLGFFKVLREGFGLNYLFVVRNLMAERKNDC